MTEYTTAVSCWFASIGNVYKGYYHLHYLLVMITTGYIWQKYIITILKPIRLSKLLLGNFPSLT